MKISAISLILLALGTPAFSQSVEEGAVLKSINRLFEGMKTGDSAKVHSAFASAVSFVSISKDKSGAAVFRRITLKQFLTAVGTAHAEAWSEMIWDTHISVDGDFAQVWTNYGFYRGNKFSHCGVDAFHLFKGPDGNWRIFDLADTRRTEECMVPPSISDKFK